MSTNYVDDLMINLLDDSIDDDLRQLANDDKDWMESLQVSNNKERNLLFYLDSFVDDVMEEFGYTNVDVKTKEQVVENSFKILKHKEKVDLFDIRYVILKILNKDVFNKKAYPNTIGTNKDNMIPERNVDKWVKVLKEIHKAMKQGHSRNEIELKLTEGWEPMERYEFKDWAKYYESRDHEKYNIKTAAPVLIPSFYDAVDGEEPKQEVETTNPQRTKTPDDMKRSLVSRLDSASRLLREFAGVWSPEVWRRLSQALSDLKREIIPLRSTATISDCIFKAANRWEKDGFVEGANFLNKVAEEPDVATEIENALTGKQQKKAPKPKAPEMSMDMDNVPDATQPLEMAPMDAPAAPNVSEMPELEMPELTVEEELLSEPSKKEESEIKEDVLEIKEEIDVAEENPFDGQDVEIKDILEILEPILQQLSEREFVRALSKADMMLDSMNVASHFPELGEAMSKSLEMNIYISSRIEKIINKLKGGIREEEKGQRKEQAPEIELEELTSPTEKSTSPIEQEMLEIKE